MSVFGFLGGFLKSVSVF